MKKNYIFYFFLKTENFDFYNIKKWHRKRIIDYKCINYILNKTKNTKK